MLFQKSQATFHFLPLIFKLRLATSPGQYLVPPVLVPLQPMAKFLFLTSVSTNMLPFVNRFQRIKNLIYQNIFENFRLLYKRKRQNWHILLLIPNIPYVSSVIQKATVQCKYWSIINKLFIFKSLDLTLGRRYLRN